MGYGDSGWPPHTFFLREGQNVDVGILKLFLSRNQVDLSHIAQSSPFVPIGGGSTVASTAPSSPFVPVGSRSTTTPSPFVPIEGRATTPSSSFVSSRGTMAVQPGVPVPNVYEPNNKSLHFKLPWDTVEISVVQRRAN